MRMEVQNGKVKSLEIQRFSSRILRSKMEAVGMSQASLGRELVKRAPDNLSPGPGVGHYFVSGLSQKISSDYLTLFSIIFDCSRDDFFE